jgi:hypothetical protein
MPPKKVVEEEVLGPWSLGRFSSNLKVRLDALDRASSSSKIASRGWMDARPDDALFARAIDARRLTRRAFRALTPA